MKKRESGLLVGLARFLGGAVLGIGAGVGGLWVGGQARTLLTGRPVQTIRFESVTPGGQRIRSIPVVTKFYPALAAGLLGKPFWLFSYLGGLLIGLLVDDRYEERLWGAVGDRLWQKREESQVTAAEL